MNQNNFYCRTEERRIFLVENYIIKPVTHLKLLNGQIKESAANDIITDQYYCFSYINKSNNKEAGTFLCGTHVAKSFLKLTNEKDIPLFNPLRNKQSDEIINRQQHNINGEKVEWNILAFQLYNAINILLSYWQVIPYGKLLLIINDLQKYPKSEPFKWKILEVNRIIGFDKNKRTLYGIIKELHDLNNDFKDFDFSLLIEIVKQENIENNFGERQ